MAGARSARSGFSQQKIVRMIDEQFHSCWRWLLSGACVETEKRSDCQRLVTGMHHPLFNCVMQARFPRDEADRRVREILGLFKSQGLPLSWYVAPSSEPVHLGEILKAEGMVLYSSPVGMTIDLGRVRDDLPTPEELSISRVSDMRSSADFCSVLGAGFEFPSDVAESLMKLDAAHGFEEGNTRTDYVGYVEGKPVASTMMHLLPESAGIYCVATIPEMRKKGIATAMLLRALQDAKAKGYKIAVLHAKLAGAGVYRRIGVLDQPWKVDWYAWAPGMDSH